MSGQCTRTVILAFAALAGCAPKADVYVRQAAIVPADWEGLDVAKDLPIASIATRLFDLHPLYGIVINAGLEPTLLHIRKPDAEGFAELASRGGAARIALARRPNSLVPDWGTTARFARVHVAGMRIVVRLEDYDPFNANDPIGFAVIRPRHVRRALATGAHRRVPGNGQLAYITITAEPSEK
jgi:hypothetical protein